MGKLVGVISRVVSGGIILAVRAYQVVLSPHIGNCCRFEPSCSAYCIEALRIHGVFKGCWLTFRRVMRCRPFGPSGHDPVPPRGSKRSQAARG
jgi:putative membrane protein insertion efficiency factor